MGTLEPMIEIGQFSTLLSGLSSILEGVKQAPDVARRESRPKAE